MSKYIDNVYSIEPSLHAQEIAKKIYPNSSVNYINAFAQIGMSKLTIDGPALFNSSCVLSHLDDNVVEKICSDINLISKTGSCLSFSECYGLYFSDSKNLWHVRTQDWWKNNFPGWEFHFLDYSITHPSGAFKGFWAQKTD